MQIRHNLCGLLLSDWIWPHLIVIIFKHTMPSGIVHPMVWGTSVNSLALILKTIYLFLSYKLIFSWWRHQMEIFSELLAIYAGNSPATGEFPTQRPVTRSFDVYFDLRPNERLSKQWWGWWFETLSRSLWRHRNVEKLPQLVVLQIFQGSYPSCGESLNHNTLSHYHYTHIEHISENITYITKKETKVGSQNLATNLVLYQAAILNLQTNYRYGLSS